MGRLGANGETGAFPKGAKAPNVNLVFVRWGVLGAVGTTGGKHKEQEQRNINATKHET